MDRRDEATLRPLIEQWILPGNFQILADLDLFEPLVLVLTVGIFT